MHDLVIRGGRVIDPETGHDAIADVALSQGRIAAIGPDLGPAGDTLDASGQIVAPGFVDLHAHGQSLPADRMQAFDGVTTALELEVGALPVAGWYDAQSRRPRLLNHGTTAAWLFARKAAMIDLQHDPGESALTTMGRGADDPRWSRDTASPAQVSDIVARLRQGIAEGGLGIGIPYAYAPGAGVKEMSLVCDLAAEADTPTFTHVAQKSNIDPKSSIEAYVLLIGLAGATGAHMHICHLNSTSLQDIERATELIRRAQDQGLKVTTEAYPYGTGSTVVSADFFKSPDFVARTGTDFGDVELVATHRRFTDQADLSRQAARDPSALVLWHYLDTESNPRHQTYLDMSVMLPGGAIASDAMPWSQPDGSIYDGDEWPLGPDKTSHPRSSGTFTRFLRQWVRERQVLPWSDAIAKCTLIPTQIVETCAPAFRRKGRLQPGCDADVTVFDPQTVGERATFAQMNLAAQGMRHVVVGGSPIIREGALVAGATPGRPIRRGDV